MKTQWLDDPVAMRLAGPDLLSLALMDSRNALLQRLAVDESGPALRLAAHAGWHQEYWIARHVQRQRGEACDASAPRLAGTDARVDCWLVLTCRCRLWRSKQATRTFATWLWTSDENLGLLPPPTAVNRVDPSHRIPLRCKAAGQNKRTTNPLFFG